jgi:signal transduction histidine kinase
MGAKNTNINKNFFELLINTNPDLICRYSLNKEIEFINDTIFTMTGLEPESFINKSIYDFGYPADFMNAFDKGFDDCVNTKTIIKIIVCPEVGPLANQYFDIQFVPILNEANTDPNIIGVFSVSRNITEQKKLELLQAQQIEELNILSQRIISKANKLQNFAYIVSHNLRTPANGLLALTNMFENVDSREEELKIIGMLNTSSKSLCETIEDLSETVKINQNINIKIEELAFSNIVNHIKDNLASLLLESGTSITADFTECSKVYYHKVYLESIFHNLITNAIKYKDKQRKPMIRLKTTIEKDGKIRLSCTDNGSGINLVKNGEKIFGLHKTFHGNKDARGVGLFITKTQIEAMGGSIEVESEVGVGTTFHIYFNQEHFYPNAVNDI